MPLDYQNVAIKKRIRCQCGTTESLGCMQKAANHDTTSLSCMKINTCTRNLKLNYLGLDMNNVTRCQRL